MFGGAVLHAGHPLVSVIVPVYNKARHLEDSLRAVLLQDIASLEVICVDDCSTDDSLGVLKRFERNDARVKVVEHEQNKGAGYARNTGIDQAQGEFLAFLDADDWYNDASYLSRLYHGAIEHDVPAAGACLHNVRSPRFVETSFSDNPDFADYIFAENGVIEYRDYQYDYGFPRFMFSHALFESLRFDNRTFYEDPVVLVRALDEAKRFFACKDAAYLYRLGYRKPIWTTSKVLDLLEGVRLNLQFSRERDYAKLHWMTLRHLDWEADTVGVGINRELDVSAISSALSRVEGAVSFDLLQRADPVQADFKPALRIVLDELAGRPSFGKMAEMDYQIRASKPWYHLRNIRDKYFRS